MDHCVRMPSIFPLCTFLLACAGTRSAVSRSDGSLSVCPHFGFSCLWATVHRFPRNIHLGFHYWRREKEAEEGGHYQEEMTKRMRGSSARTISWVRRLNDEGNRIREKKTAGRGLENSGWRCGEYSFQTTGTRKTPLVGDMQTEIDLNRKPRECKSRTLQHSISEEERPFWGLSCAAE